MKRTVIKQGSARFVWLGLLFVGASAVMAQAPDEASSVKSDNTVVIAAPGLNSSELLKLLM